jgi:predicted nucleic acid-binding protein
VSYLLDSCIIIDHFNGIAQATDLLREHGTACVVSAITRAEVLAGFGEQEESLATALLDVIVTLPVTAETADIAARLRRHQRWKLPDAFQAALVVEHGLTLVTRNTKDFRPGGEPAVWIPYRV